MTERQSFTFTRDPKAVGDARGVLGRIRDRIPAAKAYDASLCLSELVTNAIQHSPAAEPEDELELTVELGDRALRVEVSDPGSSFEPGEPREGDARGWGLFIVDRLASRWGVDRAERTTVWFEIEMALGSAGAGSAAGRTGAEGSGRGQGLMRATALRRAARMS
jgi:anti-sigma regulatory factor (Ser/Thr protein kinase)